MITYYSLGVNMVFTTYYFMLTGFYDQFCFIIYCDFCGKRHESIKIACYLRSKRLGSIGKQEFNVVNEYKIISFFIQNL